MTRDRRFRYSAHLLVVLVALLVVAISACGETNPSVAVSPTPTATRPLGPEEGNQTLAEAARRAASEDGYRIQYRQTTGRDIGTLVLARRGDQISVRLKGTAEGKALEMFAREGGAPPVFCLHQDGRWGCVEGDEATANRGAPIFIEKTSFEQFAARVATIPADQMRITGQTIAGKEAVCYDTIPREDSPGGNPFTPTDDILGDLLRWGGSICFAENKMLKLAILYEQSLTFEALEVGKSSAADFEMPAGAEIVAQPAPSPVPTVIQGR